MTGPKGSAVITREDVERAQAVIDTYHRETGDTASPYLRGLITQAITDAQVRGYDQGVARGRRLIANAVRDALEGEGL